MRAGALAVTWVCALGASCGGGEDLAHDAGVGGAAGTAPSAGRASDAGSEGVVEAEGSAGDAVSGGVAAGGVGAAVGGRPGGDSGGRGGHAPGADAGHDSGAGGEGMPAGGAAVEAGASGAGGGAAGASNELTPEEIEEALSKPRQPFRFHHVHLNAVDPDGSVAFYGRSFGAADLGFTSTTRGARSGDHWLLFDPATNPPPWELTSPLFHLGFGVSSVQGGYDALVSDGVVGETAPFNSGERLCTGTATTPNIAFLYGPDREVFELNVAGAPDLRHVHFLSEDPIAAGRFFLDHFGITSGSPNPSSAITYCQGVQVSPIFGGNLDGITFYWYPIEFGQGYYPAAWEGKVGFDSPRGRAIDHLAFSVADLDQAVIRLRAEGVTLLANPSTTLDGQLRSAFIEGPDGTELEIVEGHVAP